MLQGCMGWPDDLAARYRAAGLWEGVTIPEMVERTARSQPEKIAIVCGERRISYAELIRRSRLLAFGFAQSGISAGERVVMQLPNIPEFVTTYLALNWIGAIPVMALRAHRHAEVRHFLDASGAIAYVVADRVGGFDYRDMARDLRPQCQALRHIIVAGEPAAGQIALDDLFDASIPEAQVTAQLRKLRPAPGEVATMLLSGGTTSMSKLIPRTHDDYVLNARLCGAAAGFDRNTVFLALLPLGHNYNLASPGLLGTFYHGGTVIIGTGTSAEEVFAAVEQERVTVIAAVVPLISNWLNSDAPGRFDVSSLRVIQNGGARLAPELRVRLRTRLRCTPQEIYGTAEGLINMTGLDDPEALLMHSSGAPVSKHDEIRVVDDSGKEVADGVAGELVTRGPYTIRGYYNAPEKNAEAFLPGGWYRMGDIVRREGRHVFTEGRRKDLINRGGEKISCEEIENLIFAHPKVKSVVLVAMPDPVFGEKACACVVLKSGETLGFDELMVFLRAKQIASFKLPERLEVMTEFPVSPVGKILKSKLREQIAEKLASENQAA